MLWICKETLNMRKLQTKTWRNYAGNGRGWNNRLQFPLEIDINWAKHPKSLEMPSPWGFNLLNCALVIQGWLEKSNPLYMLKSASRGSQHNLTSSLSFEQKDQVCHRYTRYFQPIQTTQGCLSIFKKVFLSNKLHQSPSMHNHWSLTFKQLCNFYSKKNHKPTSLGWG